MLEGSIRYCYVSKLIGIKIVGTCAIIVIPIFFSIFVTSREFLM